MPALTFNAKTAALILIDLQNALAGRPVVPHSFDDILTRTRTLAAALRAQGATIVYVRVDVNDMLPRITDEPARIPTDGSLPATLSELVPNSGFLAGDLLITKRSWGAFYHTGLDQQLRDRGIDTLLIGGVATNMGVESTARAASDHGYQLILIEDLMATLTAEAHTFAITTIFPRLGLVRSTEDVLEALKLEARNK